QLGQAHERLRPRLLEVETAPSSALEMGANGRQIVVHGGKA
ncbi:MAG: hypothetical protein QOI48_3192, partial [Solirubrobacteraceae bacterium]|nr:hypothetical protein [Solirubrobacteraceae bacterium]